MWVLEDCHACGGTGYTGTDGHGNRYVCETCDFFQVVYKNRRFCPAEDDYN